MAANAKKSTYSGAENQSFRQFEHLFRGFIGVAEIPFNQQSNFLQFHHWDAALRCFQTLPNATRNDLELSPQHSGTTSQIKIFKKPKFLN